jgi:hypothetical protein
MDGGEHERKERSGGRHIRRASLVARLSRHACGDGRPKPISTARGTPMRRRFVLVGVAHLLGKEAAARIASAIRGTQGAVPGPAAPAERFIRVGRNVG